MGRSRGVIRALEWRCVVLKFAKIVLKVYGSTMTDDANSPPAKISPLDIDVGLLQEIASEASQIAFTDVLRRGGEVTGLLDGKLVTISAEALYRQNAGQAGIVYDTPLELMEALSRHIAGQASGVGLDAQSGSGRTEAPSVILPKKNQVA